MGQAVAALMNRPVLHWQVLAPEGGECSLRIRLSVTIMDSVNGDYDHSPLLPKT